MAARSIAAACPSAFSVKLSGRDRNLRISAFCCGSQLRNGTAHSTGFVNRSWRLVCQSMEPLLRRDQASTDPPAFGSYGTIRGGHITTANRVQFVGQGGTLDGVTLDGSATIGGAQLVIQDGTLAGATLGSDVVRHQPSQGCRGCQPSPVHDLIIRVRRRSRPMPPITTSDSVPGSGTVRPETTQPR